MTEAQKAVRCGGCCAFATASVKAEAGKKEWDGKHPDDPATGCGLQGSCRHPCQGRWQKPETSFRHASASPLRRVIQTAFLFQEFLGLSYEWEFLN